MLNKLDYVFPWLLLVCTIMSVNLWNHVFTLGDTTLAWIVDTILLMTTYTYIKDNELFGRVEYKYCKWFLIWMFLNAVRGGVFMCECYWDYKNLISTVLALSMPIFAIYFGNTDNVTNAFKPWVKLIPLIFFGIMIWCIFGDSYHFLLTPVLLFGFFYIDLNHKWKAFVAIVIVLMLLDLGNRAQVIKALFTITLAISFAFNRIIPKRWLTIGYYSCFILPILLLVLGVSGNFNVFEDFNNRNEGKYYGIRESKEGDIYIDDASADTRTFIYEEVISSAIDHNYVIWGRTPARGNDSMRYGAIMAELVKNLNRCERLYNEVCHPNIFTWLGLIGLILHCLIYLQAAKLAFFESNSIYMQFIGMAIAFNWALGWIENTTGFNIMNLTIWLMIGMGLSTQFRQMDDEEFQDWFVDLFE